MKLKLKKEIETLFSSAKQVSMIYHEDWMEHLPEPGRRYFRYALKENQQCISYARMKHCGQLKLSKKWASIKGEEYFTVSPPGFAWFGKAGLISGKDTYFEGCGRMQIKLLSIIRLADTKGKESNQGELVRWLSETVWLPTALLPSKNLRWETDSADSAKVFLTEHGITVEAAFFFNEQGQITKFKTKRYGDGRLQDWICQYRDYREVEGMHIPFYAEAGWNSESEDDKYAKFRIEKIEYDYPSEFSAN